MLGKISETSEIQELSVKIKEKINSATFILPKNKHPKYWWTQELAREFRLAVAAQKEAIRESTPEKCNSASLLTVRWKETVRKAKISGYMEKIEEINAFFQA